MTVSSTPEAKLSGRGASTTPAQGPLATLLHLVAMLGAEQAVLPALGVANLTPAYGLKAMGTDALHHLVYAGTSGLAYDYL
jgi:hypothetical protein